MDYNGSNGSPTESLNSKTMSTKQYFLVNLSKFIVEMVGTLTVGVFYFMIGDQQVGILLGLWVIILFGESISGSHFNPAITLVFMLRKNSSHLGTRRLKGIFYIVAQMAGGLLAGFFAKIFIGHGFTVSPRFEYDPEHLTVSSEEVTEGVGILSPSNFAAIISECAASTVFIFLFMLCTDKKTQYSEDKVINCFIMSASYVAARLMGGGGIVTGLRTAVPLISTDADGNETVVED